MYKHILIPTDGSPASRRAILDAVRLARALGARVTGVFAEPPATPILFRNKLPAGYATPQRNQVLLHRAAVAHLEVIRRAARAAGVPCRVLSVRSDYPAETILQVARQAKCDLIVMASRGRKGLSGMLLGSETQKVLHASRVPVMVLRGNS
jgi:nucleotide-binding universal stress UspA family protein